ncbi:MAG: DUF1440 domain-containing protein [Caulobacteraceae bacterium]
MAVGIGAGLFASHVMNQFQKGWAASSKGGKDSDKKDEPSTVKLADRVCLALSGRPIPHSVRPLAGEAVHFGLGAVLGAAYAGAAHFRPAVTAGAGTAYSSTVWLGLDEGLLPALGLGAKWADVPASRHFYGLISHLFFGLSLDGANRLGRRALAGGG